MGVNLLLQSFKISVKTTRLNTWLRWFIIRGRMVKRNGLLTFSKEHYVKLNGLEAEEKALQEFWVCIERRQMQTSPRKMSPVKSSIQFGQITGRV